MSRIEIEHSSSERMRMDRGRVRTLIDPGLRDLLRVVVELPFAVRHHAFAAIRMCTARR